jgi:two-component system response regulator AlgR
MSPIAVVIVDDEPLARQKLRRLFEADRGFEVVGEAGDGEGALRVLAATRPTLVCLDIRLPGLSGLDVLRKAEPRPPAVIFTTAFDQYAVSAFEIAFSRPSNARGCGSLPPTASRRPSACAK